MLFLISFSSTVEAANIWGELQATTASGKVNGQSQGGVSDNLLGSIGYFGFAQAIEGGYHVAYVGPTIQPIAGMEVGIATGKEWVTGSSMDRRAAYLFVTRGKLSLFLKGENGGTGRWNMGVVDYALTDTVIVGLRGQSFLGAGPRVEVRMAKNLSVWGAVLWKNGVTSSLLTLKMNY
jgi:hypothetical protein